MNRYRIAALNEPYVNRYLTRRIYVALLQVDSGKPFCPFAKFDGSEGDGCGSLALSVGCTKKVGNVLKVGKSFGFRPVGRSIVERFCGAVANHESPAFARAVWEPLFGSCASFVVHVGWSPGTYPRVIAAPAATGAMSATARLAQATSVVRGKLMSAAPFRRARSGLSASILH
jgi:hypothetical protein